ncbi:hypothetical protein BDN72DRAFT_960503 [Pluteus cervinus]|uniref:Uncharacterized protein n=1 Tax=Pluteus cervinus TaxID=181527 RepID=A0ACD3ARF2_9AGAR|nr:hypothetical protein BDN72DRAFT_960503 [Pluteus cervinus]
MSTIPGQIHQPLHPSIIPRLDPEYVQFHNAHVAYIVPPHRIPWDAAIRKGKTVPGSSEPLPVGKVQDFELEHCRVRAYTPEGTPPEGGWPVFLFFHGGGWTLGNIASEATLCTTVCVRANCVVVSVDYRLAPEHPYPAAVDDAVESLEWVVQTSHTQLGLNLAKIAVGGSSSGGNLAAILALKAVSSLPLPHPLLFQVLIVPVTDCTTTVEFPSDTSADPIIKSDYPSWTENIHTAWLTPARMDWFYNNYLPISSDAQWKSKRAEWTASPILAPTDLFRNIVKGDKRLKKGTWIGVAEVDLLRDEGIEYGEKLKKVAKDAIAEGADENDVTDKVEVVVYEAAPHPLMAMDAVFLLQLFCFTYQPDLSVLSVGKKLVSDVAEALVEAFRG